MRTITTDSFTRILLLMILGFQGISLGLTNLNLYDTRNIVERVDESVNNTQKSVNNTERIVESGETRARVLEELRETQQIIEETRQNQTERLIQSILRQFNQTERIDNLVQNMSDLITRAEATRVSILQEQIDISQDVGELTNATTDLLRYQDTIVQLINRTAGIN